MIIQSYIGELLLVRVNLSYITCGRNLGLHSKPCVFNKNKIICIYSLSDLSLAITFATFFVTKRSSLPSKLGKPLWGTTMCMYKHTFCLSSAKC